MYSGLVGKHKYHLCVRGADVGRAATFVFLNRGYAERTYATSAIVKADLVPIPPCETGLSEIALRLLIPATPDGLKRSQPYGPIGTTVAKAIATAWRSNEVRCLHPLLEWEEVLEAIEGIEGSDPLPADRRKLRAQMFAYRGRYAKRGTGPLAT